MDSKIFVDRLDAMPGDDPDQEHSEADDVLLRAIAEAGYPEIRSAYYRLINRCSWWATA